MVTRGSLLPYRARRLRMLAKARCLWSTITSSLRPRLRTRGTLRITLPSEATAPNPASGRSGICSFLTTITWRGQSSSLEMGRATATPPFGMARTRGCADPKGASFLASSNPASCRSAYLGPSQYVSMVARPFSHLPNDIATAHRQQAGPESPVARM